MFRIRRIYDDVLPVNRRALAQVQQILRAQFPLVREKDVLKIPEQFRNPLKYRFRPILMVAENGRGTVRGFALILHAPDLEFAFLDFVAAAKGGTGGGLGGALYEGLRAEAQALGARGLFFECLPDDPALSPDPVFRRQNAARLKFYERYGARPVAGTLYETPVRPGDTDPPYLVFDALDTGAPLRRERARAVVRAILERKYGDVCPPDYVERVVGSFRDDPVRLREFRYVHPEEASAPEARVAPERRIALVVSEGHAIHHVQERGYVEAPVRIASILKELEPTGLFRRVPPAPHPESHIRRVHRAEFVDYLRRVSATLRNGEAVYPYVFPVRNAARPPKELAVRAGYFCIDTFTPLTREAHLAATEAVHCALTAARALLDGSRLAYALVRPPGHHAERSVFGGFCYFNNAAIAADHLSRVGRVAVLDVDYHHGNGQQDIFYERRDVLTLSIHGHPSFAYPYFSGFTDERGEGEGKGYNLNVPLPESVDGALYRRALARALAAVRRFKPTFLVVALGLDTAKGDPTGTWSLGSKDFEQNGRLIGSLGLPTLVVQEGGYRNRVLGTNARHFFRGLWEGAHAP